MIGKATILKWIREELKDTATLLGLKLGKPEKNLLFCVYYESNAIRCSIPMAFWSQDEMMIVCPHINFTSINKALFDLTGIEEFGINSYNYKCNNISGLGKTTITSRAQLDLYLWPLKKHMRDYFTEVESVLSPKVLVDNWYEFDEISEVEKYFPLGHKHLFIYFLARINNDTRSSKLYDEGKNFYIERISLGYDIFEEHLKAFTDLKKKLDELGDNHYSDLLANTFKNTSILKEVHTNVEERKTFIRSYYLTDVFTVTDQIGSTILEFEKYGLLALSDSNIAFYDIGDSFEELKKKAEYNLQKFNESNFEKSEASFSLGEYENQETQLIFKQYSFNLHQRIFKKIQNGDLENDGRVFTKIR